MLDVRDVSVRFKEKTVVDHISFSVSEGEWLMIVGPNGAGKSTLLKAVAQDIAYEGSVWLDGEDFKKKTPRERARRMAFLPQRGALAYAFSVEEVVEMGRYAYLSRFTHGTNDADKQAIDQALEITGLTAQRKRSVLTLSGGEQQRAFLAQVFAQGTQYLLLDEPTNHLDLVYQQQIFNLISDWRANSARAVVSVTHDLSLAKAYGDKVLLMSHAKAAGQGTPQEVLTPERLESVYEMDVTAWMQKMYAQWN